MSKVINDLLAVSGTYEINGEKRNRFVNIGKEIQNDEGESFLLIDSTINLAAFPRKDNDTMVVVSKYAPRQKEDGGAKRVADRV